MRKMKRFFSLIPALVLWLMVSGLVWGFVFTRITDTDPAHKLTLFIDTQVTDATALAVRLEEHLSGNIKMVKVHPFTYAMLDGEQLKAADLFIIRADHLETYRDWLTTLPEEIREDDPWGVQAYDAETHTGIAADCINYRPLGEPEMDYFLCFGNQSRHNPSLENAVDNAAAEAAKLLLGMK